jgi:hypothetical protein
LVALSTAHCKAFDESLLDASQGPSCDLERPPARPDAADVPGGEPAYFFAIRDLVMDQREGRWETIGYDLDELCSEPPDFQVECRAPAPSAPPETDGVRGTDNALGHQVVPILIVALPDLEEVTRADQDKGVGVALIQIEGWNGEDDDPLVQVIFSQSAFGTTVQPDAVDSYGFDLVDRRLFVNGEEWPRPAWEGEDYWYARSDGFLEGDPSRPRIRDDNAYVADSTLVLRLPDRFPIVFGGQMLSTTFLLSDATFTARISADRQTIEEAKLSGRFAVNDILETVKGAGVCPGSSDYMSMRNLLNLAADIRTVPGTGGPGAECDALSVGLLYENGIAARFGGVVDPIVPPDLCVGFDAGVDAGADGGTDAGMDSGTMDSGVPDTGAPDTGAPDTGAPDSGLPDTGAPDSGPMDAGVSMDAAADTGP